MSGAGFLGLWCFALRLLQRVVKSLCLVQELSLSHSTCVCPLGPRTWQPWAVLSPRALQVSKHSTLSWIIPGWCSLTPILVLCFQLQHDHELWINLSAQFCAASVSLMSKFKYTWFHPGACLGHNCGTNTASALLDYSSAPQTLLKGRRKVPDCCRKW